MRVVELGFGGKGVEAPHGLGYGFSPPPPPRRGTVPFSFGSILSQHLGAAPRNAAVLRCGGAARVASQPVQSRLGRPEQPPCPGTLA